MKWLLRLNWLGIDVALGAGVLSYALAFSWNVAVPFQSLLLLVLVVWLIYTLDHLRDARAHQTRITSVRRQFHQRNFRILTVIGTFMLLTCFVLLPFQPPDVLLYGSFLALLVSGYFVSLHYSMPVLKEPAAALFYTLGICLLPFAFGSLPYVFVIHVVQIFLVAISNLILFSWFEFHDDQNEGFPGFLSFLGIARAKVISIVLIVIQGAFCLVLIWMQFHIRMELCFLGMSLLLILPVLFPRFWQHDHRFRVLGDAVFFLPLLTLLDAWV